MYGPLVWRILKELKVYPYRDNYEDLAQLARIELVRAYEIFPSPLSMEEVHYPFLVYAKNRMRWRLIDELRRLKRRRENEVALANIEKTGQVQDPSAEELVEHFYIESFKGRLSSREAAFVDAVAKKGMSVADFAKAEGIRRESAYKIRKRLQKKLKDYQEEEKNEALIDRRTREEP